MFAMSGPRLHNRGGSLQLEVDEDLHMERRTQKYLFLMHTVFTLSLLPIMTLRLLKHRVQETYANSGHFDVLFCIFVWIACIPLVIVPCLISFWTSTMPTWRQRVWECFCFGGGTVKLPRGGFSNTDGGPPMVMVPPPPPAPRCPTSPIAALGAGRGSRGSLGLAGPAAALSPHHGHGPDVVL